MAQRELFYPERFKDASRYYSTGRPTYPRLLAGRVAKVVGVSPEEDVLDLGTGPGFLAIDFAPLARAVTAVDPSPEMLDAARNNAKAAGAEIRFVRGSSYELGPELGRFKLVTIGRAFHWMDRPATLRLLDGIVEAGGGVTLFGESYPDVPANVWRKHFQEIVDGYSTDDPARPKIRASASNESVLLESSFDHLERVSVLETRRTPIERFVDRALSFASTWHGRAGSREQDLAEEIRSAVAPHADAEGNVTEVIEGHALIARRSRDLSEAVPAKRSPSTQARWIDGVQDVYYNVRDLDRALAFYQDVLGLPVLSQERHFAALDVGGVRLGLHWTGGEVVPHVARDGHGAYAGATVTLKVGNIQAAADRLAASGVRLLGPISKQRWGSLVPFEDPDGNVLKLFQSPSV
jgi:SAM-dependent methyltransferase